MLFDLVRIDYIANRHARRAGPRIPVVSFFFKSLFHFIHVAAVVPVAVAMMTPIPLLAALAIQKVRSLLGYQTKGRCPVAVTGEPNEMDMKDSESKQKLVRDPETNGAEAAGIDDGDLNNEKPIVKSANGCPMKGTA